MITEKFRTDYESRIKNSCDILQFSAKPDLVIQAGSSGHLPIFFCLNDRSKKMTKLSYDEIGFPKPTAPDHVGNLFIFEEVEIKSGKKITIWLLAGRHHYYESMSSHEAAFITRVCVRSGATHFIFMNAAGGISGNVKTGDLMFIDDCGSTIPSPNIGMLKNGKSHFTNCSNLFDKKWYNRAKEHGAKDVKSGSHFALAGPEYESPVVAHEIRMSSNYSTVGMSTVPEVWAGVWENQNIQCAGVSTVTNHHFDKNAKNVSAEEVASVAKASGEKLAHIVWALVATMEVVQTSIPEPANVEA